jgi:iron complex transport system substrate-binding protein
LAGGENAYRGAGLAYPLVSTEGIMHCNPEVIIDLVPFSANGDSPVSSAKKLGQSPMLDDWQALGGVAAVQEGRVYAMDREHASSLGPRMIRTVEEMARLLHPEIDWSAQ